MTQNDVLNDDLADLLQALLDADARFLVVGAHAMGAHGVTRATGDLDVLVQAGVSFAEAWEGRTSVRIGALDLPVLGLEALRRNKAAAARPKDLLDLILLDQAGASLAPRDPPA